ncbi:DUF4393 domain-containing protein [Ruminococcus albus]|uniref:DUF4393 domain-containing protein n=1 Tax=Ruminococcus albus 8 TaxID=246199 RepID=E9SFC7_RUMAL|nr:DUF4393 domain-containing protein [Ruminococcus albus]EGC02013.1 hypothetical protein CUS_4731 [Ruminococcus albus 8]MCC3351616.1 DUF4393 domain-containing protein [Ruminococcus albus 8]
MSDKKKSSSIEKTIDTIKETRTFEEADKSVSLVLRTINAAISPIEKWVIRREYSVAETKKLLEQKLQNIDVDKIITPPSYIAIPALQAISYCMDDEQLRDMYAELLASAMNSDTVDNVHPTYVEIIKQMSPFDAVVFKKLASTLVQPCIGLSYKNKRTKASYPIQDIVAFPDLEKFPIVPTQISLENLERLKLIDIQYNSKYNNDEPYERLKWSVKNVIEEFIEDNKREFDPNAYEVVYKEYMILIRGFGQFFARACLGADFSQFK